MTYGEQAYGTDQAHVGAALGGHDPAQWRAEWWVEKYQAPAAAVRAGTVEPYEVIHRHGNLLTYQGVSMLWDALMGGLSTGEHFDNGQAAIAVGDDNTAAAASQTDLQASSASSDRAVVGMEASYPLHTTGNNSTANQDITFRSVFSTNVGNFAWQEWAIKNSTSSTAGAGKMLNRKVESLGTKTTSATWTVTVKLSIS